MNRFTCLAPFLLVWAIMSVTVMGSVPSVKAGNKSIAKKPSDVKSPTAGNYSTRYQRQVCFRQSDCPRHASCFNGNCECFIGFNWNDAMTECNLVTCLTDKECLKWPDSTCKSSICVCAWFLDDGRTTCSKRPSTFFTALTTIGLMCFMMGVLFSKITAIQGYFENALEQHRVKLGQEKENTEKTETSKQN